MSEVIDLKPGVDYFPSKRERRMKRAGVSVKPRRALANGGVGKRFPVSVDVGAVIEAIAPPGPVRDLMNLAAKEWAKSVRR
jgi:hypothetical protein